METLPGNQPTSQPANWGPAALVTGLLAGTLDITAAGTQYALMAHKSPIGVLHFVASGVFGPAALAGGAGMALAGLLLHYLLAVGFAVAFYWLYPRLFSQRTSPVLLGLLYGVAVWLLMNLVVVPNSHVAKRVFKPWSVAVGMSVLVGCIGLPIAWRATRYYAGKSARVVAPGY